MPSKKSSPMSGVAAREPNPIHVYRKFDLSISIREFARRIGASPAAVSNWERETIPQYRFVKKIARMMGVEPGDLLREIVEWHEKERSI